MIRHVVVVAVVAVVVVVVVAVVVVVVVVFVLVVVVLVVVVLVVFVLVVCIFTASRYRPRSAATAITLPPIAHRCAICSARSCPTPHLSRPVDRDEHCYMSWWGWSSALLGAETGRCASAPGISESCHRQHYCCIINSINATLSYPV